MADEIQNEGGENAAPAEADAPAPAEADAPVTADAPAPADATAPAPAAAPEGGQPIPYQSQHTGMAPRRPFGGGGKRFPRRKVCAFCVDKLDYIDYKDTKRIKKFVTERGKILPRRITGNCAAHQRMLTVAIKRARTMALVAFVGE